jgi:replicative DNA helicase
MADEFEKKVEAKGIEESGIKSGFSKIDEATGGWKGKNLIYVGARPSQGKSALLCNMAVSALEDGANVGIITVESSKEEITTRMVSSKSQVPLHSLKTGLIGNNKLNQAIESYGWMYSDNLHFYDEPNANIMTVLAQARRMVTAHRVNILFVDYCQLIYPANRSMSRVDQVSDVSIKLKQLARDLNIPVICAAQLRRDAENRAPMLSDFADSSQLEKDADIAILIQHDKDDNSGEVQSYLHMDKHRDGQTASIAVRFIKETVTFQEDLNANNR